MITSTFTTSVGDITITIDDGGTSTSVEVEKLGQLKYEFDQTPDSVQIDRTIALYSYIQVVYQEQTAESEDLYDRLIANLASSNADVTLSIDNFGADTFDFSFELKQENVDFNQKDGSVTVRFTPKYDQTATISSTIRGATNYNFQPLERDGGALKSANINCLPVSDFLNEGMQDIFGNSFDAYIKTSKTSSNVSYFLSNADWTTSNHGFIVVDPGDITFPSSESFFGEPNLLSIKGDVSTQVFIEGPYPGPNPGIVYYIQTTRYYIEQTDIGKEFATGTGIGWKADNDTTTGPFRVFYDLSTADQIRIQDFISNPIYQPDADPAPLPQAKTTILSNTDIYLYNVEVNTTTSKAVQELAAVEGSIYGTGFSKNFYVHRLADNDSEYITLNYDLVSDIKQKKLVKHLNSGVIRQIADYENTGIDNKGQLPVEDPENIRFPNLSGIGSFVRGNENATKSLEINLAPVYPYLNKATKSASNYISILSSVPRTTPERAITSAGVRAYMQSLNQQGGGLKIELTYLSALALKPYELFQFDSTAPEKYQNKQYRITAISYDFVKDETKIVGYQINSLATPIVQEPVTPPPTPPPTEPPDEDDDGPGDQTTLNLLYKPGWNFIANPTNTNVEAQDVFGDDYTEGSLYEFFGVYIGENDTIRRSNSAQELSLRSPGYVVNIQPDIAKYYTWPGVPNQSNVSNIRVYQGWNLIGALGVPSVIQSNTVDEADIDENSIFRFDGSYVNAGTNFQPGFSHWVYSSNAGGVDLIVSDNNALPASLQDDFKRIDIKGNDTGISVYFDGTNSNTNVNIQTAKYPPAIANNFDVRINQDETNAAVRDLRAVESNTINIDVQQIDAGTTLNIVPKIGVAASSYYQCTFLDGDKIITAQNVGENTAVDVPITTSRIQVQPMGASIKLPVRAKDIANDDGELLDSVPIAGATGAIADRIQYMNDSGYLTELITTGTADFIQAVVSRPEFSAKQNNVPSKSQVFLFSYDGTGGLTDNYISGFSGGSDGKVIRVINVGSNSIVLSANDTGSTAGNRILGSNVTLGQYEGATLIYIEDFTGTLPTTTIDGWIIVGRNN